MTKIDPPEDGTSARDTHGFLEDNVRSIRPAAQPATPVGSRPILWRWWLVAGAISLGLWAGIVFLIT